MAKLQDNNQNDTSGTTSPRSPASANGVQNGDVAATENGEVSKKAPVPAVLWKNVDVMKWMKRCCVDYYNIYGYLFHEHEITGRSLVRLNDISLEKMGIKDGAHRNDIRREILKLKLKGDILEIKDLQRIGAEQRRSANQLKP